MTRALRHWALAMGGAGHAGHFAHVGHFTGLDETFEKANQANRHGPELRPLIATACASTRSSFIPLITTSWISRYPTRSTISLGTTKATQDIVGQSVLTYMFSQPEGGVMCPMAMTYSVVPSLRMAPAVAEEWMPRCPV